MPTGGGKSICFQIPALCLAQNLRRNPSQPASSESYPETDEPDAPITVVLSPLVALMKDQVDGLVSKGIDATFVNSSLDRTNRELRYHELSRGRYDLLYVTPERFRKEAFLQAIQRRKVVLMAVDEAHCISQWGHDFRPDYTLVRQIRKTLGDPTTIALTATATREVQRDILAQLGLDEDSCPIFHTGIARPNLHLRVAEVWGRDEKIDQITQIIAPDPESDSTDLPNPPKGPGIVYFTLIRTLDEFSEELRKRRVAHICYHGDLPRSERKRIQDQFMSGKASLVLATNAFGMGVDKDNIRFVIHAEIPGSLESYYQEIGRAGRDGKTSHCVLLYDQADLMTQMEFVKWKNPAPAFYQQLYALLVDRTDEVNSFGVDWLRTQLAHKQAHDRRLETALSMLHRYGTIEDEIDLTYLKVNGPLPADLVDNDYWQNKLQRDQKKLLALVQYAQCGLTASPENPNHSNHPLHEFLADYFLRDQLPELPFTANNE